MLVKIVLKYLVHIKTIERGGGGSFYHTSLTHWTVGYTNGGVNQISWYATDYGKR